MKVMITGATGFVGSHTTRAALASGHDVRLLVRTPAKVDTVLGAGTVDPADIVQGDMTDESAVAEALDGCDACVHTAAVVSVSSGGGDLSKNTDGARIVLGSAVAAGCDPVVYTSTVGIFVPPHGSIISADSPLADPRSEYGKSKIGAEHYTRGLADAGAPVVVFYPGGVTGPEQPALDSFMEGIEKSLSQGLPICSTGGVTIIDVRDLADAIVSSLVPGRGPRRYMSGGPFFAWEAYADLLEEVSGYSIRRIPMSDKVLRGMGAMLDGVRRVRDISWPVNRESTEFMTLMVPTDDTVMLDELGVTFRPTADTIADSLAWMVETGHLDAKYAPAL